MLRRVVLGSLVLAACGQSPAATAGSDAAAEVAPVDASASDTADPWAGAPPAICRQPAAWSDQKLFEEATLPAGLQGVVGIRLSTADLDGDLKPELSTRRMAGLGKREDFTEGKRAIFLLKNTSTQGGLSFADVTQASGLLQTRDGQAGRQAHVVVYGDADNDGDVDVFAGATLPFDKAKDLFPQDSSELLLGDGKGSFALTPTQTFADSQLRRSLTSATFVDYDRDGKLDLWLGYASWGNPDLPIQDQLLRGDGQGGFQIVTDAEGLATKPWKLLADVESGAAHRNTWGTTACDLNGDGHPELLTASYGRYFNGLWLGGFSGGDGKRYADLQEFSHFGRDDDDDWTTNWNAQCYCQDNPSADECDKTPKPKVDCAALKKAFGGTYRWNHANDRKPFRLGGNTGTLVCADLDRDGDLDVVATTIVHPDVGSSSDPTRILRNDGQPVPQFSHLKGKDSGLQHTFPPGQEDDVGDMTAAAFDADNDGRLDVLIASSDYPGTRAKLFRQLPDGRFAEVPLGLAIDHPHAHGVAVADFDRDGDLDVALGHSLARCQLSPKECQATEQVRLWRNTFASQGNWLQVQLVGTGGSNRSAIGARVRVTAGGVTQTQEVGGGYGHYGMQQDLVLHFGLGSACQIDAIEVRWPDAQNTTETWKHVRANYLARLVQGDAKVTYPLHAP